MALYINSTQFGKRNTTLGGYEEILAYSWIKPTEWESILNIWSGKDIASIITYFINLWTPKTQKKKKKTCFMTEMYIGEGASGSFLREHKQCAYGERHCWVSKEHCQSTPCFAHILLYSQTPVGDQQNASGFWFSAEGNGENCGPMMLNIWDTLLNVRLL